MPIAISNTNYLTRLFSRAILLSLFFFLQAKNTNALPEPDLDSLKSVLLHEKTDEKTLNEYIFHAINQMLIPHKNARLTICFWALKHAKKQQLQVTTAEAMFGIAKVYADNDDFVNATQWCVSCIKHCDKYQIEKIKIDIEQLLGFIYYFNKQYSKAEKFYRKSIPLARKYNDTTMLFNAYTGLAIMHIKNKTIKHRNTNTIYRCMDTARIYLRPGRRKDDAIYYYTTFSTLLTEIGEYDSALIYLNKAKSYIDASVLKDYYLSFYLHLGHIYLGKKNWPMAEKSYLAGLAYCKKQRVSMWMAEHLLSLSKVYTSQNRYREAFEFYAQSTHIRDSIINATNFAKAADIEYKYEREKKENQILQLNNEQRIDRLELDAANQKRKQLTTFLVCAIIVLLLLAALAILLFKNIQERKIAYAQLQEKGKEIQKQTLQLAKQERLIAQFQSQMNPHFVFNALHNIQGLVITHEDKKATQQIQSLAQLMRKTFANAEKDDINLEEEINYLKKYMEFEMASRENKVDFQVQLGKGVEVIQVPPMMLQPFVENAIKHAELDKVKDPFIRINIEVEGELLRVNIQDNGTGIKKPDDTNKLSHSMSVIKSRIELLLHGKKDLLHKNLLRVQTMPEITSGTSITFYLPLIFTY
ncbi:MAG TPA: histidine kinase [Flavobacteriales bacterium]|nr:histidine kinase [Flavobacteriales bacterium]